MSTPTNHTPASRKAALAKMALAHHEAGHLCAASSIGVKWSVASIDPGPMLPDHAGLVLLDPSTPLDAASEAFVFFAGPYAQARFANRPVSQVVALPECRHDWPRFAAYFSPENIAIWSEHLSLLWPAINQAALSLMVTNTIDPDSPNPLNNDEAVLSFIQQSGVLSCL